MSLSSTASSSSASSSDLRSSDPGHRQQLTLLKEFVQKNLKLYESFRYEPWTTKPRHAKGISLHPSELVPGTIGVHVQSSFKGPFVCNYPGALMWEELHDTFDKQARCPTAVRVPVLDYLVDAETAKVLGLNDEETKEGDQFRVRMVLVGDPCAVGPLINSPRGLGKPPNCLLETCLPRLIRRHVSPASKGRFAVESDFLAVNRNNTSLSSGGKIELLQLYESDSDEFWSRLGEPFCDRCCKKTTKSSELVTCTGNGCQTSRHVRCGAQRDTNGKYHCPRHASSQPIPMLDSSEFLLRTPPPVAPVVRSSSILETAPSNLSSRLDSSA